MMIICWSCCCKHSIFRNLWLKLRLYIVCVRYDLLCISMEIIIIFVFNEIFVFKYLIFAIDNIIFTHVWIYSINIIILVATIRIQIFRFTIISIDFRNIIIYFIKIWLIIYLYIFAIYRSVNTLILRCVELWYFF